MNVIEARGLTKVYGGRAVVRDFAMTVAAGDIYGFVGKNGAGKSTVMKMICGDALPTAGEVVLFESDRASAGDGEPEDGGVRRIGVLIEEPGLLVNLSAYRNLMAKALAWGIVDGPARCEEVLRLVGLSSVGNKKVRGFSLGMKQRLGLAMALLGSPDVLLLDEPFNGLDPEATRAMRNLIVRVNETLGITVVVSSHVLDQLDRMATRYGVIADGRVFCVDGEEVALTRTEFNILELLMGRPQKVFTKQELFELAWGEPYSVEDSTVNVHVSNLRRKLKPTGTDGYLQTVWGMGYKLHNA